MNLGLLIRSIREIRGATLAFTCGLFLFELLLGLVVPTFQKEFSERLMQVEFLQKIIAALLGTEVGAVVGPTALAMLGWVHPMVLALVWAHAIVVCTRFPAGELDRGTLDVLMSLPVSRTAVYAGESLGFMLTALVVVSAGLAGNLVGGWMMGLDSTATPPRLLLVCLNLYTLSLAVGGVSAFLSSICDRRGRAMGAAFAVLLASFFLSSMSTFNPIVKQFSTISLLNYYRPYFILRGTGSPIMNFTVLGSVGFAFWAVGWMVLIRRDLRTA